MIHIAVVEDEASYSDQLREYLARFQDDTNERVKADFFFDGNELVSDYRVKYDIILLDIQMKFMDGITAAEHIREKDSDVIIIFITNMVQYAIRGYEVDALDFIIKPVNYLAFSQKLRRAVERLRRREKKYMTIPVEGGMMRLDLSQVWYVESMKHRVVAHTVDGGYSFVGTLKAMEEKLAGEHFFRCNNYYLVNLAHVEGIRDSIATVGGDELQISRPRRKAFLAALTDYMGGGR